MKKLTGLLMVVASLYSTSLYSNEDPIVFFNAHFADYKDINMSNTLNLASDHYVHLTDKREFIDNIVHLDTLLTQSSHTSDELWELEIKLNLLSGITAKAMTDDEYLMLLHSQLDRFSNRYDLLLKHPFKRPVQTPPNGTVKGKNYGFIPRLELPNVLQVSIEVALLKYYREFNGRPDKACNKINAQSIRENFFAKLPDLVLASQEYIHSLGFKKEVRQVIVELQSKYWNGFINDTQEFEKICKPIFDSTAS